LALIAGGESLDKAATTVLEAFADRPHIFNLGHGILQDTPIAHVERLSAHVIFVIFWMAGMFMLPRYLVYHQEAQPGSAEAQAWVDRETKLRNIILTPAMILVWVLGISLAVNAGLFSG